MDNLNLHSNNSTSNVPLHLQTDKLLRISPTDVGSMIKNGQCPRYMKLKGDSKSEEAIFSEDDWVKKMSLKLLSTEGNEFEEDIYKSLEELELFEECTVESFGQDPSDDHQNTNAEEGMSILEEAVLESKNDPMGTVRVFEQFPVQGNVGPFSVAGNSDLVIVYPLDDGSVDIRVLDIKASWNEKTSQQIQTSIYTLLLRQNGDFDDSYVSITAGILYKENADIFEGDLIDFPAHDALPQFDVEPREDDARRLLDTDSDMYKQITKTPENNEGAPKSGPTVDELIEEIDKIPYQIDHHCEQCEFRDICFSRSIETLDLSILGINQGTREAMHSHGINNLRDLANLTNHLEESADYMDVEIKKKHKDVVLELQRENGVQNIKDLSLQAKLFIGQLNQNDPDADGMTQILPPKSQVYPKTLPDFKKSNDIDESYGLKIFVNPQYDYVSDSVIQLNAKVKPTDPTLDDSFTETITKTIEDIPVNDPLTPTGEDNEPTGSGRVDIEGVRNEERELVKDFTNELLHTIENLADHLNIKTKTIPHFYLYSEEEKNTLVEAMERHSDIQSVNAFRNLLGVRDMGEREQQLWGYLEDEIKRCYLVNRLPTFIPSIHDSFIAKKRGGDSNTWNYEYNGETYALNKIFGEQFFDYKREYIYKNQDIELKQPTEYTLSQSYTQEGTPIESYTGAQLPLEYFWGKFDLLSETFRTIDDEENEDKVDRYIQKFLYTYNNERIGQEELDAFGSWIVDALDTIESEVTKTYKINKKTMDVTDLHTFELDSNSFADSVRDYIDMEHESQKDDLLTEFEKPVSTRVREGKSIPAVVTDIETSDTEGSVTDIEAKLAYDIFDFNNIGFIKSSSKLGDGDYVVISPLEENSDGVHIASDGNGVELKPEDLLKSPSSSIKSINTTDNTIKLSVRGYGDSRTLVETEYIPEDYLQPIYHGQKIILDANLSTYIKGHHEETLEASSTNQIYNFLNDILNGNREITKTNKYDKQKIDEFINILDEIDHKDILSPNNKQGSFVRNLSQLALLQGPPGTGKTSGALTTTLLSRIYSNDEWSMNGLVTGPSNTSVDELFEDLIDRASLLSTHSRVDLNLSVYRLVSSSHEMDKTYDDNDNVEIIENVNGGTARTAMKQLQNEQLDESNTIIFGTTSMIKRFLESQDKPYEAAEPMFDMFVADEGSMLTLPDLFMAGAFVDPDGQMLISGDHRQMSPVQTHEWEEETRPSIQKYIPYLSALDYMRFLRGDDLERIGYPDAHIESPEANIPLKRLEVTYRCHKTIANFLQRWVYDKDDINYKSDEEDVLTPEKIPRTDGLQAVFDDKPLVVITHDDRQSQESNVVEADIAEAIMDVLENENNDSGVVTPHSSQKGLLRDRNVSDEADTVERFQGGERDLILVSATVSDPSFIRKEDDFLLNPNRVNVAISRMKKKLIVIVPQSVFEHIPNDVDVYSKSVIWNGLYNEVIDEEINHQWSGYLKDFSPVDVTREDVEVNVYAK